MRTNPLLRAIQNVLQERTFITPEERTIAYHILLNTPEATPTAILNHLKTQLAQTPTPETIDTRPKALNIEDLHRKQQLLKWRILARRDR